MAEVIGTGLLCASGLVSLTWRPTELVVFSRIQIEFEEIGAQ